MIKLVLDVTEYHVKVKVESSFVSLAQCNQLILPDLHSMALNVYALLYYVYQLQVYMMQIALLYRSPSVSMATLVMNCCVQTTTSVKIIQLNEYGCRDAPCEKSWKQGNPLSNTIKDTSTIMRNPLSELCREGYA